ncbi:MAG: hypothetical protein H7839_16945, partial [Magnetococcus sp. YQC-5]
MSGRKVFTFDSYFVIFDGILQSGNDILVFNVGLARVQSRFGPGIFHLAVGITRTDLPGVSRRDLHV